VLAGCWLARDNVWRNLALRAVDIYVLLRGNDNREVLHSNWEWGKCKCKWTGTSVAIPLLEGLGKITEKKTATTAGTCRYRLPPEYKASFFISVINQLDAQNVCLTISLFHASTCFKHMCSSSGGQNCITQPLVSSHLSGIITPEGV